MTVQLTGRLTYAIGDIHGRADLLERLIEQIREDARGRATSSDKRPLVVFLGDYVDRGPDSRGVIDGLLAFARDPAFESRFLLGNHEDAMLDFLEQRITGPGWNKHGGGATVRSYGVRPPADDSREGWSALRGDFRAAVSPAHQEFLRSLELMVVEDRLLFVHAGIRPGVPLDQQTPRDLLWIRSDFLKAERDDAWLVVHGHTPAGQAYGAPGRLCLDSGAYISGKLTAARFDGADVALIETDRVGPRPFTVSLAAA